MEKKAARPLLVIVSVMALFYLYQFVDEPRVAGSDEEKLAATLEQMAGVGRVSVYFHLNNNKTSSLSAYFQPEQPQMNGVLIVAEGATTPRMVRLLQNSVSQLLHIPKHRIVIVPMEMEEER